MGCGCVAHRAPRTAHRAPRTTHPRYTWGLSWDSRTDPLTCIYEPVLSTAQPPSPPPPLLPLSPPSPPPPPQVAMQRDLDSVVVDTEATAKACIQVWVLGGRLGGGRRRRRKDNVGGYLHDIVKAVVDGRQLIEGHGLCIPAQADPTKLMEVAVSGCVSRAFQVSCLQISVSRKPKPRGRGRGHGVGAACVHAASVRDETTGLLPHPTPPTTPCPTRSFAMRRSRAWTSSPSTSSRCGTAHLTRAGGLAGTRHHGGRGGVRRRWGSQPSHQRGLGGGGSPMRALEPLRSLRPLQ